MTRAYINRIGTAVPPHDIHQAFIAFVEGFIPGRRERVLFDRMAQRSGIEHRYSFFAPREDMSEAGDTEGFFRRGAFPGTAARMARFERDGVALAAQAVAALGIEDEAVSHLVVASCTGFTAPGLDQVLMERLGLDSSIERTMVGFMGCSAAVNALRTAHHIVRSEPQARVLVVNVELCTLHLQESPDVGAILTALLFGDGASAALVTADPAGLALRDFKAATIPGTQDLITWRIADQGFDMGLSGEVPAAIAQALRSELDRNDSGGILRGARPADFDLWAVHAGGRTVLDAVEQGLELGEEALGVSRAVLRENGNMSSATIMFVLERMLRERSAQGASGLGMAFGPGMVAETFRFERLAA